MKKLIKLVALILSVFTLATMVACGAGEGPSQGQQNMNDVIRGLKSENLSLGQYGKDKVYVGPFTFEVDSVYATMYASGVKDDSITFQVEYWKQYTAPLTNPAEDFYGSKQLTGPVVYDVATGSFKISAKVYDGTKDQDFYFTLSNLSIDEYYENGAFNLANIKVDDVTTNNNQSAQMFEEYVPFVVEAFNVCLSELDAVYTAKGYPIGK